MVALLTSVRNSPCFGGLRRTKTCHWQLFARPSTCFLCYFLHAAKSNNPFPLGNFLTSRKFAPVGAARSACYEDSRFCKPRISAPLRGFSAACGGYPCCCRNNMFAASRHFFGASGRRPLPRKHAHTGGSSHKQIKTFRKTESFPLPRHILHNKRL